MLDGIPQSHSERERWFGVELRHLAALLAVAQERSFRGAALRLGYVQSAISQQIAVLERRTGTRLVDRAPGPGMVSLTQAGEVLAERAEKILTQLRLAQEELGAVGSARPRGAFRGCAPGAGDEVQGAPRASR